MPAQVALPPVPPPAQPPPPPPPPGGVGKPTDVGPTLAPPQDTAPKPPVVPPSEPVTSVTTSSESKGGGKGFILGFLIGLIVAVLAGAGAYLWQQDVGKKEVEAANARVAACNEEKDKSLSAATVWKDQFVKLSQAVNSSEWIAEHCAEAGLPETEATEISP